MSETIEVQQAMATETADVAQMFVGKNYEYYQRKWQLVPGAIKGFSVAAFFLGVVWMVYRKMYLYTAIVVALLILDGVLEAYFPLPDSVSKALTYGIYAAFGIMGNTMYKAHVDKKIKEISATFPPEQVHAEIAKQGGVNLVGAWAFGVTLLILFGVLVWWIMTEA